MIPAVNLALILVDALCEQISLVLNYAVLLTFLFLTVAFLVTSSLLVWTVMVIRSIRPKRD